MFPSEQLAEIVKRVFIVKPFYFDVQFESESYFFATPTPPPYIDHEREPTWANVRVQMWNGVSDVFRFRFIGTENFENELLGHHKRWLNQAIYGINPLLDFVKYCFPETRIHVYEISQDVLELTVDQLAYCHRYQIDRNHFRRGNAVYVFQTLLLRMVQDNFQTWHGNNWTLNNSARRSLRPIDEPSYNGLWNTTDCWNHNSNFDPSDTRNLDYTEHYRYHVGNLTEITGKLPNCESEARKKATGLLLNWLSEEQKQSYLENKTFIVIGGETGTKYRIRPEHQINIDVLTGELQGRRLCIVSQTYTPLEDQLLAQKLMIENNESYFLETADLW